MESASNRRKILDASVGLFAAQGFHGTAVPMIAAAAGVAVGTLYRYFPTKDALANAVIADCQSRFEAEVLGPLPATASPRAAFRLYWRRMAGFAKTFPLAQRFLDLHDHSGYAAPELGSRDAALLTALRHLVAWGRREGTMKALEPALVAALLRGALMGLTRPTAGEGTVSQHLVEEMEDCLWNAVAAR